MDNLRAPKALVRFIHVLGTDDSEFAWLKPVERVQDRRDQWAQMDEPVRRRPNEHDAKWQTGNVLLMLEAPIHGQQGVKAAGNPPQQLAVCDPAPASIANGGRLNPGELGCQVSG